MTHTEKNIKELDRIANVLQHVPVRGRRIIIMGLAKGFANNNAANLAFWLKYHSHMMSDFLISCVEEIYDEMN